MARWFVVVFTAVVLTGCTETTATSNNDADVKALKDIEAQWNKDFEAKDASKLILHYADDAVLMNSGMAVAKGKQAIQKSLTDLVGAPGFSLKFEADRVEVSKSGDIGYTQGHYTLTMTDSATKQPVNDHGSYVTIYKKQADGSWKAVQDAAISEVPPPAPAPAPGKKK